MVTSRNVWARVSLAARRSWEFDTTRWRSSRCRRLKPFADDDRPCRPLCTAGVLSSLPARAASGETAGRDLQADMGEESESKGLVKLNDCFASAGVVATVVSRGAEEHVVNLAIVLKELEKTVPNEHWKFTVRQLAQEGRLSSHFI